MFQTDLKGIPVFMMNHVLKRHPLALFYVRRQLTDPEWSTSHVESPTHEFSDEEDVEENLDGSVATKLDGKSRDTSRTKYEQEVSTQHFIAR